MKILSNIFSHFVVITERIDFPVNILSRFVTFAGNNQNITRLQTGNGCFNSFCAIADILSLRASRHNLAANVFGIFGARIVIRHKNDISQVIGYFSHNRALGGISVSATAKNNGKPIAGVRFQRFDNIFQSIR